ncbi:hypothetical protein [Spirosoma spitsbergense]|uniref:hypothetical protein n=1 Tax=Spirosoma spitsbergense TaxID=431554 RepID=UPI000376E439|nr:hypothetical protein [Spirosoma spitsbergense]
MNPPVDLEQLITEGIRGLPQAYLSEVADFVVFVRRKAMEQQPYDVETIQRELSGLAMHEQRHLDEEFQDFDQQFPKQIS